jgi:hypothetical protein
MAKISKVILAIPVLIAFLFSVSCSSESKGDGGIPLTGPQDISIVSFDSALQVGWSKVAPAQGVEATYEVWFAETDDIASARLSIAGTNSDGNLVTAVIKNLENGKIYHVWVKARFGSLGESDFSPSASGAPIAMPAVPINLLVFPSENSLEVTWEPSANAYSYEIAYSESSYLGDADIIGNIPSLGVIIPDLNNGENYYVWVRAVNTAGRSAFTVAKIGTPEPATTPPAVPVILEAKAGNKKILLKWGSVRKATKYDLCASTINDIAKDPTPVCVEIAAGIGDMAAAVGPLANGALYYVWLRAANNVGKSDFGVYAEGIPAAKPPIDYSNPNFVLGHSTGEFVQAEDLPPSHFHPSGVRGKDRLSRRKETAIGNLWCDGAVWYAREIKGWNVDFAFLNGGMLSSGVGLKRGDVTVGGLIATVGNTSDFFVMLRMRGDHVKLLFDAAADVIHNGIGSKGTGAWGMVSKDIRYTIEYPIPPENLSTPLPLPRDGYYHGKIREGSLKLNGIDIADGAYYNILTVNYLAVGQDGYWMFPVHATVLERDSLPNYEWIGEYIYDSEVIIPALDGRVTLIGGVPLEYK